MKNKLLRILLAAVLMCGIIPANLQTARAGDVIHTITTGYDTKAVAVRYDMTCDEISRAFRLALDDSYLATGTHYDRNCCYLVYLDSVGEFKSLNNSTAYPDNSHEYYFVINIEENSGYSFDTIFSMPPFSFIRRSLTALVPRSTPM